VAITLDLPADEAISLHIEYYKLLAVNEFTRVYPEIKENPWPFFKLVILAQDAGISDDQVVELLKVSNGHLPRVKFEYGRLKAEINSLEAEKGNSAKVYQQLCDRILELRNRADELQSSIRELQDKKAELDLQKTRPDEFAKDFQAISSLNENEVSTTSSSSLPQKEPSDVDAQLQFKSTKDTIES
jgi:hypothetical protein